MRTELPDTHDCLAQLERELRAHLQARGITTPRMVGILTGGAWVARHLHAALALPDPMGTLDISFHRDDFEHHGLNPTVRPSMLPWPVDGAHVVLVDDVLHSGRTVRAALNELFDWGRPATVTLAVLAARGGRELPIQADACGIALEPPPGHALKLRGPSPLRLEFAPRAHAR